VARLTQEQEVERRESDRLVEGYLGPIIGKLIIDHVSNGGHPQWVLDSWKDKAPALRDSYDSMPGRIAVYAYDAFNSLVDGDATDEVLQYWMGILPTNIYAELGFEESAGRVVIDSGV